MTLTVTRSLGSFGELVTTNVLDVQCGLWQLGFDPGRIDGLWGPNTEDAFNRWFRWWQSRQAGGQELELDYQSPPNGRGGIVRMPEQWSEVVAAALRGPCAREPRGTHRPPPVPEPTPLGPAPVVTTPDGGRRVAAPQRTETASGRSPWVWVLGGAVVVGIAVLMNRRGDPMDGV